jgi:hypothetical protein
MQRPDGHHRLVHLVDGLSIINEMSKCCMNTHLERTFTIYEVQDLGNFLPGECPYAFVQVVLVELALSSSGKQTMCSYACKQE